MFGGIAGIIAGERREQDEDGYIPSASLSRDQGEMQDIYRRTLEASWTAQNGELNADECIEDIFTGGDGWKKRPSLKPSVTTHLSGSDSENGTPRQTPRPRAHFRTASAKSQDPFVDSAPDFTNYQLTQHQVDEIRMRDDLKSWTIPSVVSRP